MVSKPTHETEEGNHKPDFQSCRSHRLAHGRSESGRDYGQQHYFEHVGQPRCRSIDTDCNKQPKPNGQYSINTNNLFICRVHLPVLSELINIANQNVNKINIIVYIEI